MNNGMNNINGFMDVVRRLAASQPRTEVTAPTADQVAIAAGILRLATLAETAAVKISNRQMSRDEWNNMSDAYRAIGELAAVQGLEAPVVDASTVPEIEGTTDAGPE